MMQPGPVDRPADLLAVENLSVGFERSDGNGQVASAVEGLSFSLQRGRTLCLVGESGCGKSVTALSLLRLLPSPPSRLLGGHVFFEGRDLAVCSEKELSGLRGSRISMIFQDPMTSLNPVMRVGDQIAEGIRLHKGLGKAEAGEMAVSLLDKVGIFHARERVRDFPHQMSGGMRQRVMIAMALSCNPALLIADEPTTALDVTVQRQILALMRELIEESGSGLLLITHDFGVVSQIADDVAVMYAGRIVEQGPAAEILREPLHPYTVGLLHSLPGAAGKLSGNAREAAGERGSGWEEGGGYGGSFPHSARNARLGAIAGSVPDIWSRPGGCAFHPRCTKAFERCKKELPPLFPINGAGAAQTVRLSRCWLNEST